MQYYSCMQRQTPLVSSWLYCPVDTSSSSMCFSNEKWWSDRRLVVRLTGHQFRHKLNAVPSKCNSDSGSFRQNSSPSTVSRLSWNRFLHFRQTRLSGRQMHTKKWWIVWFRFLNSFCRGKKSSKTILRRTSNVIQNEALLRNIIFRRRQFIAFVSYPKPNRNGWRADGDDW